MSALNIPLTIMFADVLACRMILDLRARGYEISQPTTHGPTLPLSGPFSAPNRTNETSTFEGDDKQGGSSVQLPYGTIPYASHAASGGKKQGLRSLLEAGRGTLTATINSTVFSSQSRSADATTSSNSVELRSFSHRLGDEDEKSDVHSFGLPIPAHMSKGDLADRPDDGRPDE